MHEWTVEIDTECGLDENSLVRFSEAFERDSGHLAPACELRDGKLGFTVCVHATTPEDALRVAVAAAGAALRVADIADEASVKTSHVNIAAIRELTYA